MARQRTSVKITAVICTHDRYDVLPSAIASIEAQSLGQSDYEVLIVDNSTPGAGKDAFFDNVEIRCNARYISEDTPGLSRARNIGLECAEGTYVAYLDDDAIADPNWLATLLRRFESDDRIGVLGGPVAPIWERERPTWLHEWQEGYLTIVDRGLTARELSPGEWLAGTNIAFRKDALQSVGGFDTAVGRIGKLLLSNEELIVTEKVKDAGYSAFYDPDAQMRHRVHADRLSQDWFRRRASWQVISDIMSGDKAHAPAAGDEAKKILAFLKNLPIRERKIESLFRASRRKDDFQRQIAAVEALASLLLRSDSRWPDA